MDKEYIISFSSFYKAAYAQDVLEQNSIGSTLRKIPTELVKSCSTGLYLRTSSIQTVQEIFFQHSIAAKGIYRIQKDSETGQRRYIKV